MRKCINWNSVLTLKMSHSWRWVQYGMTDWSMWNLFLPYKECFWKLQNWNFYLNTYNVTIEMVNQIKVYGEIFGNKKMSLKWKLTNIFYLLAYNCNEKTYLIGLFWSTNMILFHWYREISVWKLTRSTPSHFSYK